jgi:hypothetical protein
MARGIANLDEKNLLQLRLGKTTKKDDEFLLP